MTFMDYESWRRNIIESNTDVISACEWCDEHGMSDCDECNGGGDIECDCCGHEEECEKCSGVGRDICGVCSEKLKYSEKDYYKQKKSDFRKVNGKCDSCKYSSIGGNIHPCGVCARTNGSKYEEANRE